MTGLRFNKAKLRYYCEVQHVSMQELAESLGVNPATLSRKMGGESDFYREEMAKIKDLLRLSGKQMMEIFFDDQLA